MPDRPLADRSAINAAGVALLAQIVDQDENVVATIAGKSGKGTLIVTDRRVAIHKNDLVRWWAFTELTSLVVQGGFTGVHVALVGPTIPDRRIGVTDVHWAPHALEVSDRRRAQLVVDAGNALIAKPPATVGRPSDRRFAGPGLEGAVFVARAPGGYVALWDDHLKIKHMGFVGLTKGLYKGDKEIPIDQITAIQWREPSNPLSGHIQFTIMGGSSDSKPGSTDENAMMFEGETRHHFAALKSMVEERMARVRASRYGAPSAFGAPSGPDITEQIRKLADLHAAGILSDEEFATKKAELLARM